MYCNDAKRNMGALIPSQPRHRLHYFCCCCCAACIAFILALVCPTAHASSKSVSRRSNCMHATNTLYAWAISNASRQGHAPHQAASSEHRYQPGPCQAAAAPSSAAPGTPSAGSRARSTRPAQSQRGPRTGRVSNRIHSHHLPREPVVTWAVFLIEQHTQPRDRPSKIVQACPGFVREEKYRTCRRHSRRKRAWRGRTG